MHPEEDWKSSDSLRPAHEECREEKSRRIFSISRAFLLRGLAPPGYSTRMLRRRNVVLALQTSVQIELCTMEEIIGFVFLFFLRLLFRSWISFDPTILCHGIFKSRIVMLMASFRFNSVALFLILEDIRVLRRVKKSWKNFGFFKLEWWSRVNIWERFFSCIHYFGFPYHYVIDNMRIF